jgi:hypothetical protein
MSAPGGSLEGSFSPTETTFGFVLNLIRPRGRLANRCVPSTVGMLCPAAPSMTVPTVVMMRKKKNGAHNRLRDLADDWGRLSPEELARFLCEFCQGNAEIKAFCRTIALHFRGKRGGKRSKSGPDKQWTHDRLRDLTLDFAICEIVHPKKPKHWICCKLAEKGSRWARLNSETLRKRLQEADPRRQYGSHFIDTS